MKTTRRQAEELEQLLSGELPPDAVDPRLRALGDLASSVHEHREALAPAMDATARAAVRTQVLEQASPLTAPTEAPDAPRAPARGWRRVLRSPRSAVASGLTALLMASTGVTVAAQESVPGDALYGLKRGTESVRMSMAGDEAQAARLELRFASERLDEIAAGASRQDEDVLIDGLVEMDRHTRAGSEQLASLAQQRDDQAMLDELEAFLEHQSSALAETFSRLPVGVRPYAEDSLALLREIHRDLLTPVRASCDCSPVAAAGACECATVAGDADRDDDGTDEQDEASDEDTRDEAQEQDAAPRDDAPARESAEEPTETSDPLPTDRRERRERAEQEVRDGLETTTDGLRDTVEKTTEGVGDVVEDTTEGLSDTVERTTEGVGDALEDTTGSIGGLLGGD